MKSLLPTTAFAAASLALAATVAFAQPQHGGPAAPSRPRNLQVLPRDIPQERLVSIMQHWAQALGVRCSHCHVPGNFASDDNPNKNKARGMARMTMRINGELLPPIVGPSEEPRVNCYTCHRGSPHPTTQLPEPAAPRG